MQVDTTGLPIGKALRVERTLAGLTATRVAAAVGIHLSRLSRIESGHVVPTAEEVERIRIAIRAGARPAA